MADCCSAFDLGNMDEMCFAESYANCKSVAGTSHKRTDLDVV